MSHEDKRRHFANDSVNGIAKMRPMQDPLSRSFNGVVNMKAGTPAATAVNSTSSGSANTPATPPAAQTVKHTNPRS
jgi:hypothetical protein